MRLLTNHTDRDLNLWRMQLTLPAGGSVEVSDDAAEGFADHPHITVTDVKTKQKPGPPVIEENQQ